MKNTDVRKNNNIVLFAFILSMVDSVSTDDVDVPKMLIISGIIILLITLSEQYTVMLANITYTNITSAAITAVKSIFFGFGKYPIINSDADIIPIMMLPIVIYKIESDLYFIATPPLYGIGYY